MSIPSNRLRSLYRRFLREMPARSPSMLANPSPLQQTIRADFESISTSAAASKKSPQRRIAEAEQYVQYLAAQRMYTTLIERYNPGMNMEEEERIKLTGRRVGMEMPVEFVQGKKD